VNRLVRRIRLVLVQPGSPRFHVRRPRDLFGRGLRYCRFVLGVDLLTLGRN